MQSIHSWLSSISRWISQTLSIQTSGTPSPLAGTHAAPWLSAPSADREAGLTLVEVIVATTLLGIGIAGAASVLAATSRTVAAADQRAQASHLATAEIETLRAMPYRDVVIDPNAKGYEHSYDRRTTVVPNQLSISSTQAALVPSPKGAPLVVPWEVVQLGELEFSVTRHITWAKADPQGQKDQFGYKVINIIVKWTDSTGDHRLERESGLFAGAGS